MNARGYAKVLSLAAACALVVGMLAGCSSQTADKYTLVKDGTLSVGASLDSAPFAAVEGGNPTGYSIGVIQEVAKRLGLTCEISDIDADSLLSALVAGGRYDVGVSSFVVGSEDEERVDLSVPYYFIDQAVVVLEGSYDQVRDLQGLKIAAPASSASLDYARENLSENPIPYDGPVRCFDALQAGDVSAIVVDAPIARCLIGSYPGCAMLEEIATKDAYGIAVSKDNRTLTDAMNEVLEDMASDGTIDALQKQYGI